MSDGKIQYFETQKKIYPRRVWGKFRKLKWASMGLLLGIYYLAPWIRWDRGPFAPNQAILIDMPTSRAYFFGIEIWPQEVYILTGILILAAVGLFFATSLFGRIWCGYACPQTVWTDLFIWTERLVQGDRNARMKLDAAPLSLNKIWKKGVTHLIWLLIALATGGAWVFYFNDAPTLVEQIWHGEVPTAVLGWVIALTFSTYLMAGFAREQVCTYMCPYARFQSAMFDKDTLIISYDKQRGEPRGKHKTGDSWEGRGHCIDCDSCVVVCPAGIDIRDGLQYQCISCGLCIDACNHVMDKIGLPPNLIRYDTERNISLRAANPTAFASLRLSVLRPRTFYYSAILAVVGGLILYALFTRSEFELNVLHDRNPVFVQLSDGAIRNSYTIKILNKSLFDQHYSLSVRGIEDAEMKLLGAGHLEAGNLTVLANSVGQFRVLLSSRLDDSRRDITFVLRNAESGEETAHESFFVTRR